MGLASSPAVIRGRMEPRNARGMTEPVPHPDSRPDSAPIPLPVARRAPTPAVAPAPPLPPARAQPGFDLSFAVPETGRPRGVPVLGGLAAIFGVAALFKAPGVLAPLAFLFAIGALFRRQAGWAAIGSVAGVVALVISPVFWAVVGLAWLGSWLLG